MVGVEPIGTVTRMVAHVPGAAVSAKSPLTSLTRSCIPRSPSRWLPFRSPRRNDRPSSETVMQIPVRALRIATRTRRACAFTKRRMRYSVLESCRSQRCKRAICGNWRAFKAPGNCIATRFPFAFRPGTGVTRGNCRTATPPEIPLPERRRSPPAIHRGSCH